MNLFLLFMTSWLRRKQLRRGRVCLAALAAALLSTGLAVLELRCRYQSDCQGQRLLLFTAGLAEMNGMVLCAMPEKFWKEYLRNILTFWKVSLLTAGALFLCREQLENVFQDNAAGYGILFVLGGAGCCCLILFLLRYRLLAAESSRNHIMDGTLVQNGRKFTLRALYDTGNQLVSPYTQEPVAIISQKLLEETGVIYCQHPIMIPYHSIGGSGLLAAYRLECLKLENGEIRENFLAASSEQISTDNAVQIILNQQ